MDQAERVWRFVQHLFWSSYPPVQWSAKLSRGSQPFPVEAIMATALSSLWLPIIVSGVALFFASWAAWMLLPHHKGEWKGLPDEEGVMTALRKFNIPPGQYNFPHACNPNEMNTEDFKRRKEAGPGGYL